MHKTCLVSMSYLLKFLKIAGVTYDPVKIMRYNIGELLGGYGGDIICIDVEKEGGQDRSLGDAISQAS